MSNTDIENLLIGGDWNISLQAIDKKGGSPWKPTTSREQLVTMMEEFDLVDVFRAKNPNKKSYTYESKALSYIRASTSFYYHNIWSIWLNR